MFRTGACHVSLGPSSFQQKAVRISSGILANLVPRALDWSCARKTSKGLGTRLHLGQSHVRMSGRSRRSFGGGWRIGWRARLVVGLTGERSNTSRSMDRNEITVKPKPSSIDRVRSQMGLNAVASINFSPGRNWKYETRHKSVTFSGVQLQTRNYDYYWNRSHLLHYFIECNTFYCWLLSSIDHHANSIFPWFLLFSSILSDACM